MRKQLFTITTAAALFQITSASQAGLIMTTWINPSGGNWNVPGNWNNGTPTSAAFHAHIDGNSNQNVDVILNVDTTVGALTVDAGDRLAFPNDRDLAIAVGPINNNGLIEMMSAGNGTDLRIGADLSLTGTGELRLGNHSANIIRNNFGGVTRLTNEANHTIRGAGQFGADSLFLTNNGLIDATQPTALVLDLRNEQANINTGILRASNGGTLNLLNTAVLNNAGVGVIHAADASVVNIAGVGVVGGTLLTNGSGVIRPSSNVPSFENVLLNGHLQFQNDHDAVLVGTFTNNGLLSMNSIGNGTDIRLHSAVTTVTGTGTISMSDHTANIIRNNFGSVTRLFHGANHTIEGAGQIGQDSLFLTNLGLIDANATNVLQLDLRNEEPSVNNGIMQASNGGTLNIINTATFDNTGGIIRALDNSTVNIAGTGVVSGTLHTEGTGVIHPSTNVPLFQDVTLTGLLQFNNDHDAVFANTFTNNGTVEMNSIGNGTDIRMHTNPTTLVGTGEIIMSNNFGNIIRNNFGGVNRVINEAGHTIRGSGQFGVDSLFLTNRGLVEATQSTALQLDLRNEEATFNEGTLRARDGGTLILLNTALVENAGGTIHAADSSTVVVQNTGVRNGVLSTQGSGVITLSSSLPSFENVTLNGLMRFANDHDAVFVNTFTNNGVIEMNSAGNGTDIRVHTTPVTLAGTGEVRMSNTTANIIRNNFGPVTQLINGPQHTIKGAASFGADSINLVNQGTIVADQPAGMNFDLRDSFDNLGLLHVTGNGGATIFHSGFTNSGQVVVDASRTLTRHQNYEQTAGSTRINGTLTMQSGGIVNLTGGNLEGSGVINGSVNNNGGSVRPGTSPGILTINGAYTQTFAGRLRVELGGLTVGSQYDRLVVNGNAAVSGILDIELVNGFMPLPGDTFTILTANACSGQFRAVTGPAYFSITYNPNSIVLTTLENTCSADIVRDGLVNVADLLKVITSWGACPNVPCRPACIADITGDCNVNVSDLLQVISGWGACP